MLVPNSTAGTSHLGQTLDFIPCSAMFSMWSAIHVAKIRKHLRTFPSVQSIGTPSDWLYFRRQNGHLLGMGQDFSDYLGLV